MINQMIIKCQAEKQLEDQKLKNDYLFSYAVTPEAMLSITDMCEKEFHRWNNRMDGGKYVMNTPASCINGYLGELACYRWTIDHWKQSGSPEGKQPLFSAHYQRLNNDRKSYAVDSKGWLLKPTYDSSPFGRKAKPRKIYGDVEAADGSYVLEVKTVQQHHKHGQVITKQADFYHAKDKVTRIVFCDVKHFDDGSALASVYHCAPTNEVVSQPVMLNTLGTTDCYTFEDFANRSYS